MGGVQLFGTRTIQLPKSEIVEEQINGFDYIRNAEMLAQRKWGRHLVSIWDVPGPEPAAECQEETQGVSREGEFRS